MNNKTLSKRMFHVAATLSILSMAPLIRAAVPGLPLKANANTKVVSGPFGHTYSELSQDWWLWDFMLPAADNPTANPGAPCSNGQSGNLWFLFGGPPIVNCTIPAGTSLFVAIANTECSSLEAPPFHGDTAEQRKACAKAWIDNLTNVSATVDGVAVNNLNPLRTRSGDFSFTVPAGNILGVPGPAFGFSSADGYYMLLQPLPAGNHIITVTGTFHDPFDPSHPVVFALNTTIYIVVP
jgi:hypothetical protein